MPSDYARVAGASCGRELPWGMFGENLTVEGAPPRGRGLRRRPRADRDGASSSSRTPRLPCFKLGLRFGDAQMVKRFQAARAFGASTCGSRGPARSRPAIAIELISRDPGRLSVSEIARLGTRDRGDVEGLRRALAVDALIDDWRPFFEELLERALRSERAAAAGR